MCAPALPSLVDSRETQTVAGIVSDFRVVNGQRGKQGIFQAGRQVGARVEASARRGRDQAHRDLLKDDQLIVVMGKVQPDRFSGFGIQLTVQQIWDLDQARCRFGKYLRVAVGHPPPDVARLLREHPPRKESTEHGELQHGLRVRLGVRCTGAGRRRAELQLGEASRTYPSDAALAAWRAQAGGGDAVVYE